MKSLLLAMSMILTVSTNAFALSDQCEDELIADAKVKILQRYSNEQLSLKEATITKLWQNDRVVVQIPVNPNKASYAYQLTYLATSGRDGKCLKQLEDFTRGALQYGDGAQSGY